MPRLVAVSIENWQRNLTAKRGAQILRLSDRIRPCAGSREPSFAAWLFLFGHHIFLLFASGLGTRGQPRD